MRLIRYDISVSHKYSEKNHRRSMNNCFMIDQESLSGFFVIL